MAEHRFSSTEHLSYEAVVAFVDNELSPTVAHRVKLHLVHCEECRREVQAQRKTAEIVRSSNSADTVRAPRDLLVRLSRMSQTGVPQGPDAESTPQVHSKDFFDKLETALRAMRRIHGYKSTH